MVDHGRERSDSGQAEEEKKPASGLAMRGSMAPVFILSPAPRSGTNYLAHVLELYPSFQLPMLLWEDHVLAYAHLLDEYASRTGSIWKRDAGGSEDYRVGLLNHLGSGLLSFLVEHTDPERRLLCKTPGAHNIERFPLLFPDARLLVLVRDGRDTVESAVRTWPQRVMAFERSARTWARGAGKVLDFMAGIGRDSRDRSWMLVRYEDLVDKCEATAEGIFRFLGVDTDRLDLGEIRRLPLWGSSVHHGGGRTHWDPVLKPPDFRPIGRWKSWGYRRKAVFKIIAGRELIKLGYEIDQSW
jgi:hypothetical protein